MIDMPTALRMVLQQVQPLSVAPRDLRDACGHVTGEAITALQDAPPFTKSLMDGYAIRAADLIGPSNSFQLMGQIHAGQVNSHVLQSGETVRIMTGAPLPPAADAVVMQEQATIVAEQANRAANMSIILLRGPARQGQNVLQQGELYRAGQVLLAAQTYLTPAHIGLLAELGRQHVLVHRPPRVGIVATGDELVPAGQPLQPGQIHNSNGPLLTALCMLERCDAHDCGIAPDDIERLDDMIRSASETCDVLLLTGGVSVGDKDFIPAALERRGIRCVFHGVEMKPGKPLWFGRRDHHSEFDAESPCYVFGLPGNPLSVLTGFQVFVRVALRVLRGFSADVRQVATSFAPTDEVTDAATVAATNSEARSDRPPADALHEHPFGPSPRWGRLAEPRDQTDARPTWIPCRIEHDATGDIVRLLPWRGSADLAALRQATAMTLFPRPGHYARGAQVKVVAW